jgi:hypothetical protein
LRGLQNVLDDVRELVEDEETIGQSHLPALTELLNDSDGLPRCCYELESLKNALEPKGPRTDRIWQGLMWPLKEGGIQKTVNYLEQFQQRLMSTLNVDQT